MVMEVSKGSGGWSSGHVTGGVYGCGSLAAIVVERWRCSA